MALDIDKWIEQSSAESEATPMPQGAQPVAPVAPQQSFGPVEKYEYQQDVSRQYETIVDGLPNNGRVLQSKATGEYIYVDKGTSTKDPEVIRKVISQINKQVPKDEMITPRQMRESEIRQELIGQAGLTGALAQKVSEGELFTGGTVDERIAAIAAREGRPYEEVLQDARALSRATQAEYPVASEVAKASGLLASLSPLSLGKKAAATMLPKAAEKVADIGRAIESAPPLAKQAATIGGATAAAGTEGFLYGLGEGEGGLEGRVAKGGERAQLATLFAAPISTIVTTFGRVREARQAGRAAVNQIAESLGISSGAARLINDAMDDGRSLEETVQLLRQAGNQGMIADSTEAAKTLLDTAVNVSGKARDVAKQNIEGRIGVQQSQLSQEMNVALGQPKPPGQTVVETVSQRSAPARSSAYGKAYEQEINWASEEGKKLTALLGRLPSGKLQKVMDDINEIRTLRGDPIIDMRLDVASDGTLQWVKKPTVEQLDALKKELGDMAQEMTNDFNQMTAKGRAWQQYASQLRDAIGDAVPGYKQAVGLGGQGIAEKKAAEMGEALLKGSTSLDDVIAQLRNATGDELAAAKLGLRNAIDNIIGDAKKAASRPGDMQNVQVMKLINELSSSNNRKKIAEVLGEDVATSMFKRLDEVSQGIQLRSTLGGSQTAGRTAGREAFEEEAKGGVIANLFKGNPAEFVKKARDFLTGAEQFTTQRRDEIATEVVDILSGRKGKDAELALKYIKEAQQGAKLSKPKAAIIAKELDKAMYQAVPAVELQRLTEGE